MIGLRKKIFIGFAVLLGLCQVGLLAYGLLKPRSYSGQNNLNIRTDTGRVLPGVRSDVVTGSQFGGILPHNLAVRGSIEKYLNNFESQNVDTVVLLAPNHLAHGSSLISQADTNFTFAGSPVLINQELSRNLLVSSYVKTDNSTVAGELSIAALLPILQKHFPQARYNLIIFKNQPSAEASAAIAKVLAEASQRQKILVFGTVDFSHYQTKAIADFHDLQSQAVIENFDFERLARLEIDSPAVLITTLKYFADIGVQQAKLVEQINTDTMAGDADLPSTSHLLYSFEQGNKADYKQTSLLFFGDLMLDRGVRQLIDRKGEDYLFNRLKGEEGRFFMGADYIGANLEGVVTADGGHAAPIYANDFAFRPTDVATLHNYNFNIFNTANNHVLDQSQGAEDESWKLLEQNNFNHFGCHDTAVANCSLTITRNGSTSVAWLGFSQVYGKLDPPEVVAKISAAKKLADFVVVNVHWGREYQAQFAASQQALAHSMIDAGADVIIGHHPHVVQGVEHYRQGLIFYSLGNFIFDQYFSVKTQQGLGVGINLTQQRIIAQLLPLDLAKSQPRLMLGGAKASLLRELANVSVGDDSFKQQITAGLIEINIK